jgi:hypothetical protein
MAVGAVATRESVSTEPVTDVSATSNPEGKCEQRRVIHPHLTILPKGFSVLRTKFLLDLFHQANRWQSVERGSLPSSSCTKFSGDPNCLLSGFGANSLLVVLILGGMSILASDLFTPRMALGLSDKQH